MKTIDERIEAVEAALAALKKQRDKKHERVAGWRPEILEEYFFIDHSGRVASYHTWDGDEVDLWRLSQNNVFRSEQDAFAYKKISVRAQELIEQGDRLEKIKAEFDEDTIKLFVGLR